MIINAFTIEAMSIRKELTAINQCTLSNVRQQLAQQDKKDGEIESVRAIGLRILISTWES